MSQKRKIKRRQQQLAKRRLQKEMTQKMGMFDRLPNECNACEEPFDKQDRQMVSTWNVVVREGEAIVRLYCPTCWDKAKNIIKEFNNANTRDTDV